MNSSASLCVTRPCCACHGFEQCCTAARARAEHPENRSGWATDNRSYKSADREVMMPERVDGFSSLVDSRETDFSI